MSAVSQEGGPEQARRALQVANELRAARSAIRRELRAQPHAEGRERCAVLLEDPPAVLARVRIGVLLAWPTWVGTASVDRVLATEAISGERLVGDLTARQRAALAEVLRTPGRLYATRRAGVWGNAVDPLRQERLAAFRREQHDAGFELLERMLPKVLIDLPAAKDAAEVCDLPEGALV